MRVVSESEPRLLMYPNFLSSAEIDHLLDLSRCGTSMQPEQALSQEFTRSAKSGQTVSLPLPSMCDDPTIRAIEERCAAVTGIPIHPDEEPLGMRLTSASTQEECAEGFCSALHVDTNQGGRYRCATVLLYLHAIDVLEGGETRFPCVDAATPLREAAERLAGSKWWRRI